MYYFKKPFIYLFNIYKTLKEIVRIMKSNPIIKSCQFCNSYKLAPLRTDKSLNTNILFYQCEECSSIVEVHERWKNNKH